MVRAVEGSRLHLGRDIEGAERGDIRKRVRRERVPARFRGVVAVVGGCGGEGMGCFSS